MSHSKEMFVIRIAVSLEQVAEAEEVTTSGAMVTERPEQEGSPPPEHRSDSAERPPRFRGRDDQPNEARTGDRRAMSDSQRKLLFRLAYGLGDRDGALDRVLEALGVGRLEWATRADASRAIDSLRAASDQAAPQRPGNGASHG